MGSEVWLPCRSIETGGAEGNAEPFGKGGSPACPQTRVLIIVRRGAGKARGWSGSRTAVGAQPQHAAREWGVSNSHAGKRGAGSARAARVWAVPAGPAAEVGATCRSLDPTGASRGAPWAALPGIPTQADPFRAAAWGAVLLARDRTAGGTSCRARHARATGSAAADFVRSGLRQAAWLYVSVVHSRNTKPGGLRVGSRRASGVNRSESGLSRAAPCGGPIPRPP